MATQKKTNPIKQYTKKDGSTAYMFKKYLGIDPITGKQRETTRRGFKTAKEAKLAMARLEISLSEEGLTLETKKRTYREVYEEWMESVYKNKVRESTYWNTRLVFKKHILPVLGQLKIAKINVPVCQKAANQWAKYSPKRHYRIRNYAGMVLKYAVIIEEIQVNSMDKITPPIVQEEIQEDTPENFYDRQELLDFLQKMENRYPYKRFAFFSLLAYTGIRKGEALVLNWRDIDFKQKTLSVNKTLASGKNGQLLVNTPKTKGSVRTISIDDSTLEVLKKWRGIQANELELLGYLPSVTQLIFSKTEDNSYMYPRTPLHWLDSFYNKNKGMKRITVHGFRHTHASLLFEAGANMKQVQVRLGHSTIKMTMNVYTHVTKDSKEETAAIFNEYMKNGKQLRENLGQSLGQKKNPTQ